MTLADRGDDTPIPRHCAFRIFGCMNPNTDVGKRSLPPGIRSRFTELWCGSPDDDVQVKLVSPHEMTVETDSQAYRDLTAIIAGYMEPLYGKIDAALPSEATRVLTAVTKFYLHARHLAEGNYLSLGADDGVERPHYTIRSLSRSLFHAGTLATLFVPLRCMYEALYLVMVTPLAPASLKLLTELLH